MEIIWPSPEGVDHLTVALPGAVPGMARGRCGTCGRSHDIGHAVTVYRNRTTGGGLYMTPCQVEITGWPYECKAKDKHPDATVYRCVPHQVWWFEPAETSAPVRRS